MFDESENSFPLGLQVQHDGERVLTRCLWKSTVAEVGIFARDDGRMAHLVLLKFPDGHAVVIGEHDSFDAAYRFANGGKNFDPSEEQEEEDE